MSRLIEIQPIQRSTMCQQNSFNFISNVIDINWQTPNFQISILLIALITIVF